MLAQLKPDNIRFALWCVGRMLAGQPRTCPYCDNAASELVGREKLILALRRCTGCGLLFRTPKDEPAAARKYYETRYNTAATPATDLPTMEVLAAAKASKFKGSRWDFTEKVDFVKGFGGKTLLEFGCSWGYTLAQFREAGYDVTGFEYSRPRASFGREHLGLDILEEYAQIDAVPDNSFDVIFTNHVLEHLPDLKVAFRLFARLLAPGGTLVIVVPNGSGPTAVELGAAMISQEHVTSLTAEFFDRNVADYGFTLRYMTEPYAGEPRDYAQISAAPEDLPGKELVVIARHADG